jgi:DNA repair protein RecO (recombination protein O)
MYKTEAIILRQRRLGEADRILCVFTPTFGKMDVKARGVRKTTSRMSGHLQPLTRCMLQLAQGHVSDVVAGCETLESFQPLRNDLDRLSRALYAAELVDRFVPERTHSYPTYRLLSDTLHRLAEAENADQTLRFFEMRLLDQCGFRPELDVCTGCGSPLEPIDNFFAPISGGVVCSACASGALGARTLSLNALKVLRLLQHGSYNDAMRVRIEGTLAREVEIHLRSFIVAVLERDVNAAAFIERLRREGARHAVEA